MITITLRIIHQLVRGSLSRPVVTKDKKVIIPFRCWPIDIDAFFHMNNANYLLNAELSRWRTLPASSVFSRVLSDKGMVFFAAENTVRYLRPINPMQKYVISTTCCVDHDEDKWFYYRHVFQQHPSDVPLGTLPKEYAIVDLKAVVKERSGKTIRPSELIRDSDFYQQWVTSVHNKEDT
jgi:acyl-CoA thioesterase FadM